MVLSINTNAGAMAALRNLTTSTTELERTQLRVTTGFKSQRPERRRVDVRDCQQPSGRHQRY